MKVGFAKLNISPQNPIIMGGYADRKDKSNGILDHIYAKTIVLEDDSGKRVAIISLDLIDLSQGQVKMIIDKINKLTNISDNSIVICTTHTHSGPLTSNNPIMGVVDEDYIHWVLDAIPPTIVTALESLQSCKLGWYQGKFNEIGASRQALNKETHTILTILSLVDLSNNLIGALINYNCHPTVLSAENLMISADYPGAAINFLEKTYGDDVLFAFTNGACGDVSTRFTRKSQNYIEVKRLGYLLASEVIKALGDIRYEEASTIVVKEKAFTLEPREILDEEILNRKLEDYKEKLKKIEKTKRNLGDTRIVRTAIQGIEIQKLLAENMSRLELGGYLHAFKIGKGVVLAQPAELFSSLGYEIMINSSHNPTMIIGYSNGYIGYIPDRDSYNEGGYEALACSFKVNEGEKLRDLAIFLLQEIE